jgi:hypothetical protein
MFTTTTEARMFIVCNADGVQVAEYPERVFAIEACRDFAVAAAYGGDTSNVYYIHDDADFEGYRASDFVGVSE